MTDMSGDDFRRYGHAAIDWIADYLKRVESFPVMSRAQPGEIRAKLPASPPSKGEAFDAMLRDLDEIVLPGITHWQSPSFHGFFPANSSGPSILGELLSAGLGVQGMMWATSPACTEIETHMMDWLVELLDLPKKFLSSSAGGGVIQDTASSSTLVSLIAARERATGGEANRAGARQPLTVYTSTQAHSSVEKAARICGIGSQNVRAIDVDDALRMRADLLEQAIEVDLGEGKIPTAVVATAGTTSTMAVDPIDAVATICRSFNVWLHVDAAMAGTAAICPEFRWIHDGLEHADSYCFNPHKWMFTNFDCDAYFVADRDALISALTILPEYLRNTATESGAVIDYRDWQIPLGRRFRALKLWFVIRHYGAEGLRAKITEHVALAREFADWVRADDRFELAAQPNLNLVCFRLRAGDVATQDLLDTMNASGEIYVTHTRVHDRLAIRMSIGQTTTERRHVEKAWRVIRDAV